MKKRFWTLFALTLLCCTVFAVSVSAAQTATGKVLVGTPTIDGKLDSIYEKSLTIKSGDYPMQVIAGHNEGWDMTMTATTYALYDADYLYICSVVKDDDVVSPADSYMAGTNPYNMDGVEYRLRMTEGNAVKVSVDAFGKRCFGLAAHELLFDYSTIRYKTTLTADGFVIEVAIPRTGIFAMPDDGTFGIKVQLGDCKAECAGVKPKEKTNFFAWLPTVDGSEGITGPVAYPISTAQALIPTGQTASGKVQFGTPSIDGKLDAFYKNSLTIKSGDYPMSVIAGHNEGWDMTMTATTYALYDADYLYLCSVVKDDDVVSPADSYMAGTNPYKFDGVEYRLCVTEGNTVKVSVDAFGKRCFGLAANELLFDYSTIRYKTTQTADGFIIELAIPRTGIFAMPDNGPFGIKVQLGDMKAEAAGTTPLEKRNFFSWLPTVDGSEGITGPVEYEVAPISFPITGTSGTISWSLDAYGTLNISGSGNMTAAPWLAYAGNIKKISISHGVTDIVSGAFRDCTKLTAVSIPSTVKSIGKSAFWGCSSLFQVLLPEGVTSIASFAFANCDSLESIAIPASVTNIGLSAFYMENNSAKLSSINVHPSNTSYSSDANGVLYDKNKTTLIRCPVAYTGGTYVIPGTVTTIVGSAFRGCDVTFMEIPASVTEIGELIFINCTSLRSVAVYNPSAVLDKDAFDGIPASAVLYGYTGSTTEAYARANGISFEVLSNPSAYLYTEAQAVAYKGASFTYTVSLSGTYDGFCFYLSDGDGMTVTDITPANGDINVDDQGDKWLVSILGGANKTNAAKETVVTVTVSVAADAALGKRELILSEVMVSDDLGDKAEVKCEYAAVEIVDQIPGDVNGDRVFNYYDVARLYAFFRKKITLDPWVITDINGDGTFDYYDVARLYAIFRGKASF